MTVEALVLQAMSDAEKVMSSAAQFIDADKRAIYDEQLQKLHGIITTFRREIIGIDPEGDQQ